MRQLDSTLSSLRRAEMIAEPKLEDRKEQRYVGIRMQVPMRKLKDIIPQSIDEIFSWLGKQGVEPAGPPFIRYHVINMAGKMDVEVGMPVENSLSGDERISAGI